MKSIADLEIKLPKSLLIMGAPGSGKTTLALQFPNIFVLDCDDNISGPIRYLRSRGVDMSNCFTDKPTVDSKGNAVEPGKEIDRSVELLTEACESDKIDTIVIDSLTSFVNYMFLKVLSNEKKVIPKTWDRTCEKFSFSQWASFEELMRRVLFWLKSSGKTIIWVAHIDYKESPLTEEVQMFLAVPGKLKTILPGWFEEVWYAYTVATGVGAGEKISRKIRTNPTNVMQALGLKSGVGLTTTDQDIDKILTLLKGK